MLWLFGLIGPGNNWELVQIIPEHLRAIFSQVTPLELYKDNKLQCHILFHIFYACCKCVKTWLCLLHVHFHLRAVCSSSFKIEAGSFQVRPVLLWEHLVLCQGAPSAMLGSTGPSYYSPKHLLCTRLPFNSVSLLHHNPHITTKSLPPPLSHHHITTTNTTSPWYSPESVLLFHRQLMAVGEPDYSAQYPVI